jgi:hypothetical protein
MFILKVATYGATIVIVMFFGFWELRMRRELTDKLLPPPERASDLGLLYDFSEQIKRDKTLRSLPKQALFKLRMVGLLKFVFFAILIAEVIILQK